MPQFINMFVDSGVFFDVGVSAGDVRLWLIIVIITDEILDGVVWKESGEFVVDPAARVLLGASTRVGSHGHDRGHGRFPRTRHPSNV
jgi:hypothetical protein